MKCSKHWHQPHAWVVFFCRENYRVAASKNFASNKSTL